MCLLITGFAGFFGLFGSYFSLQYLSLSDATVLAFLAPSITGFTASILLGEPYTLKEAVSGGVSLCGAVLVAQPSFLFGSLAEDEDPTERMIAVGVALIGVCSASVAYITIRKIGNKAHALHSVQYFCMVRSLCATSSSIVVRSDMDFAIKGCTFTSLAAPFLVPGQDFVTPYRPVFWLFLAGIVSCSPV